MEKKGTKIAQKDPYYHGFHFSTQFSYVHTFKFYYNIASPESARKDLLVFGIDMDEQLIQVILNLINI